jgi:colanic acid/amylovoran biosynthesis glycosyltransferase
VTAVGYVLRYWPTRSETFVAREIAELRARGVTVDVVALGRRADGEGLPDGAFRPGLARISGVRGLSTPEARRALGWLARQVGPKHAARAVSVAAFGARRRWVRVHAHFAGEAAEWALAVATVLGVPMSVTAHAVDLFVPRPGLTEVLRAARPAITICDHHARWIADRHGVEARVVRCGVPTEAALASPEGPLRLVAVGRDVPKKGLDALVRAARAAVPEAPLRLVSDAHRLGGPGVLVGPVAPDRVAAVLARATLFALPCRIAESGDRDGLPVALLEAMAAGLPVVTTAVAGIPEAVDDDVGWLVPPDDDEALVRALLAARDPGERGRRGRAGRARILERGLTVAGQVDALLAAWGSA